MALGRDIVDAIIREHSYRPITGVVLLIGQQSLALSRDEALELMREHSVDVGYDTQQHANDESGGMSAAAFVGLLGASELRTLGVSADSTNIVHDLGMPIPDQLKACADIVIDGGALTDNFSPTVVLRNYASLLRPGGRLIAINNLSAHFDPYTIPSASW